MYELKLRLIWLINDVRWTIKRLFVSKETREVTDIIVLLEGHNYKKQKPYLEDLRKNGAKINGYTVLKKHDCYYILKPTSIVEHPEWKGEPLLMIVPQYLENKFKILNVVKNSNFYYM